MKLTPTSSTIIASRLLSSGNVFYADPKRIAFSLILGFALIHLLMGAYTPLSADEAHYALYGFHLDISYFDHPPLVGWLQAIALQLSSSEWALRVFPVLIHGLVSYLLFQFSNQWYPRRAPYVGLLALALYYSTVIGQLMGMGLLPDGPLILFALLTTHTTQQLLEHNRTRDWLLLGLWLGLAGLSKYTAVTLAFSVVALFAANGQLRRLFHWKPVAMAFMALGLISPVLLWNVQHDWLSFAYQIHHGTGADHWMWLKALKMQVAQVAAYGPIVYVLGLLTVIDRARHRTAEDRLLLWFSLPILLLFAMAAGKGRSLPHWTVVGVVLLCPMIADYVLGLRSKFKALTIWSMSIYGVMVIGAIHLLMVAPLPFPPFKNPAKDLIGWKQAAQKAVTLAEAEQWDSTPVLFTNNWSYGSRLAWYARPLRLIVLDDRYDQFDLWYGSPALGQSGIFIYPTKGRTKTPGDERYFQNCDKLDEYIAKRGGSPVEQFDFYRCNHLQSIAPYQPLQ